MITKSLVVTISEMLDDNSPALILRTSNDGLIVSLGAPVEKLAIKDSDLVAAVATIQKFKEDLSKEISAETIFVPIDHRIIDKSIELPDSGLIFEYGTSYE